MNSSHYPGTGAAERRQSRFLSSPSGLPFVCLSHLRWDFVWQRPQHIMTRLSHHHPVFFVEEPLLDDGTPTPRLEVRTCDRVTVLIPVLPSSSHPAGGFGDHNNSAIRSLLGSYFQMELDSPDVIAWYYTPMALGTLPEGVTPAVTVFDAMDELANFRNAPVELRKREQDLMAAADIVFSGGPSLHDARRLRHPNAHCFPSGVDEHHFRFNVEPTPVDIAALPSPIIGFYGVLDERIDFDLITGIADARPNWSVVMIGPVVKIGESELARRGNIHYPGMRQYKDLPRYLAHFDAAILPFASNDATRFISPTKTLEYLAGGKPVVSTPIRDVIRLYGDVVEIAQTPDEFVSAIERLWNESPVERAMRRHLVAAVLGQYHWDAITARMRLLVHEALATTTIQAHPRRVPIAFTGVEPASSVPGPAD